MNPIELLLKGRKKAAKKAATGFHIVDLSTLCIPYGFKAGERWTIGAYLLRWTDWDKVDRILRGGELS